MLEFVKGDFFEYDADVRINTVNCVGVMGAGVALAFKHKYPDMYKDYVKQCKNGQIRPGVPSVWKTGDMFSKDIEIVNFPTKNHWRKPSEYEYVESGLVWLSSFLRDRERLTVTLPALGCGHGGLDWDVVKSLIIKYLDATQHQILVFEPISSKAAGKKQALSSSNIAKLEAFGIDIVGKSSPSYPVGLMRYTEKNLYTLGVGKMEFDISIISSTKPSEEEKRIINDCLDYCQVHNFSILFGGTAFDKKMASISMSKDVSTGVFLPCGIFNSAERMKAKGSRDKVSVLSVGDPFKSFDRKEYMPSVLSRMFLSKSVLFTTDKLSWVKKQSKILKSNRINTFFVNLSSLSDEDYAAAVGVDAKPIDCIGSSVAFDQLQLKKLSS